MGRRARDKQEVVIGNAENFPARKLPLSLDIRKAGWHGMVELVKKTTGEILKKQGVGTHRIRLRLKGNR